MPTQNILTQSCNFVKQQLITGEEEDFVERPAKVIRPINLKSLGAKRSLVRLLLYSAG